MSENLKNKVGKKISAMKLLSTVYTVAQAAFNVQPVTKTGYTCDSDRTLPRRKKYLKESKHFILAAGILRT